MSGLTVAIWQVLPVMGIINTQQVRVVEREDGPWFVAADVCRILGLKAHTTNGSYMHHLNRLQPETEKRRTHLPTSKTCRSGYLGIVSESGLYKLIMRSNKQEAIRFQEWVTRDVLPAIRKDGGYVMGEEKVATGEMDEDEFVLRAMDMQRKKIERLKQEKERLQNENVKMMPKAQLVDSHYDTGTMSLSQLIRSFEGGIPVLRATPNGRPTAPTFLLTTPLGGLLSQGMKWVHAIGGSAGSRQPARICAALSFSLVTNNLPRVFTL